MNKRQIYEILLGDEDITGRGTFLDVNFSNNLITEGLVMTYPSDKTIKALRNKFPYIKFLLGSKLGVSTITFKPTRDLTDEEFGELGLSSNTYGYGLGAKESVLKKGVEYTLEPKYPTDVTDVVNNKIFGDKIFHLSPLKYKAKILKSGLTPRDSKTHFNFEGRVYMFTTPFPRLSQYKDVLEKGVHEDVARMLGSVKKENDWVVYGIDGDGLKFHRDHFVPSKTIFSFFTLQNIHPENIKVVNEFSLS